MRRSTRPNSKISSSLAGNAWTIGCCGDDLQTSFEALSADPAAQKKLKFIEERVKTWVSEVIEGNDGLTVQANLLGKRVDGLIRGIQGLSTE